jgi:hypothetical protein
MNSASYSIKPLDGSPLMSANCWNVVLNSLGKRIKSENAVRCLEWGSGNSTISLMREGLKVKKSFELVSIDHDTKFFPYLAESIISEVLEKRKNIKIKWSEIRSKNSSSSLAALRRRRLLKGATIGWQILRGNKRIQYAEKFRPVFSFSIPRFVKQITKLVLIKLGYWYWLLSNENDAKIAESVEIREKGNFSRYFSRKMPAGFLSLVSDNLSIRLFHIPELKTPFWDRGVLLDGSMDQLQAYVDVILDGQFDLVFIDGRARVSCIKRTFYDNLLKDNGFLFVHDAYRAEMIEAFNLFRPTHTFINGSNVTLNGSMRCAEDFGYPLVRIGESAEALEWRIAQELFMYQN